MNIGIIGSGNIGGTLGALWAGTGHHVLFGGRDQAKLGTLVSGISGDARFGTAADAAGFGEVILLAVPYTQTDAVLAEIGASLANKIVMDARNPYSASFSVIEMSAGVTAASELVAALPDSARVVKAFNTQPTQVLKEQNYLPEEQRIAIVIAGDSAEAKQVVAQLVTDAGFAPLDIGDLSAVALQEPGGPLYGVALPLDAARRALSSSQEHR
ncbi:MAG: NAD(P)-binding domain-containing protein [Fibrella sp.]|nr:NAD(P)-binding domain-containing protein [Armatimonadota bacterium]